MSATTGMGFSRSSVIEAVVSSPLLVNLIEYSDTKGEMYIASTAPGQGTYVWARVSQGSAAPMPDGFGGWTGVLLQTGESPAPALGDIADIATSGTNGVQYDLYLYQRIGSADSNVITFTYTEDRQAPTLGLTATEGTGTVFIEPTTDDDNGTLYIIATEDTGTPTVEQIINGQDATGSDALFFSLTPVAASGAQPQQEVSGLANGTLYYVRAVHVDARGNTSTIATDTATPTATSAMASDASARYWYAPDSVQRSGSTITAWNDKTANGYNLGQVGSIPLPSYNTGGDYVEFDGTQLIGDAAFAFANTLSGALDAGGSCAVFIVGLLDMSGQAPSTSIGQSMWAETKAGDTSATNLTTNILFVTQTFSGDRASFRWRNRRFSNGYQALSSIDATNATNFSSPFLIIAEADQVDASIDAAGVVVSATATPANFRDRDDGMYLGGVAAGGALGIPFTGRIYEVFGTTDTSPANLNAIRAELNAKYGL